MKRREILKKSRADLKENFGVYLVALIILGAVSYFANGLYAYITLLWRFLVTLSSGMFTPEQISASNSDFWNYLQVERAILSGGGIIGIALVFFLVNPLSIGVKKIYLHGCKGHVKLKNITHAFSSRYLNISGTVFLSNVFKNLIVAGLSFAYIIVSSICISIAAAISRSLPGIEIFIFIVCILFTIAAAIGYVILTVKFTYNFLMIDFLMCGENAYGFSQVYNISKEMVKGRKADIFKIDFLISLWQSAAMLIPALLIITGVVRMLNYTDGREIALLGIFLIIPAFFIVLYLNMYRNAAMANIYTKIVSERFLCGNKNNGGSANNYELPDNRNPISYTQDMENNTEN